MSKYVFVKINDDITSIKRLKEMFPKIEEEDFADILSADPTYTNNAYEAGKYGKWLLSLFNKNNLKKEDLYKAKEYLEKFDKLKNKISNKDINTYKNLPDLYKVIEETESKSPTKSELKRNVQRTDLDKDAELYMETENFKIYIPLTYEASCKLGSDTQWCTATRSDRKYYDMYTEGDDKLYIFINKKDPSEKYQWNTSERYTCDRKDKEISEITLCMHYPDLIKFFERFGYNNIEELVEKIEEYRYGKEYIYDGGEIDNEIKPYLKKVKVSNTVKNIEFSTFQNCSSLESIEIPDGVKSIEDDAFYNCKLLKSVKLPNGLTSIEDRTFCNCSSLTNIEIPNSVTSIGYMAFDGCVSLKSIEIPNSVTSIGEHAFRYCSSLKSIIIPDGVTNIYADTFAHCTSLKSIELPNSLTSIGDYAFNGCMSLESIELPNSLVNIGESAFEGCKALTSIKIPEDVTNIEHMVFMGCTSLKNVIMSNEVHSIGIASFDDCSPNLVIKTKNPYVIKYCKKHGLNYFEE